MNYYCCLFFIFLFIFLGQNFGISSAQADKNCTLTVLYSCPDSETCTQTGLNSTTGVCRCLGDTVRLPQSGVCVPKEQHYSQDFSSGVSASAIAVGLLVPAISVVIIGALVLIGRRYRWISRFRDQAHQLTVRNYDNVLVGNEEDQTIG